GDLIEQVADSQRYRAELAELTIPAAPAVFDRTDMLDGLMQRGGKRTLPRDIWNKLGSNSTEEEKPRGKTEESALTPKTGKDLFNLF
ncbi:MAG: hypothetical protein NZM00_10790, partial [Anaerolinea sp.]|nr:hypothetical protein [Anaerolinea sp.]